MTRLAILIGCAIATIIGGIAVASWLSSGTLAAASFVIRDEKIEFEVYRRENALFVSYSFSNQGGSTERIGRIEEIGIEPVTIVYDGADRVEMNVGLATAVFDAKTRRMTTTIAKK